jgi:hypothetical protein
MAIGKSKLHQLLRRERLLSDALLWYSVFDTNLKNQILNWVKIDQLTNKGIDKDGDVIGYYSPVTELINPEKKAGDPYTLDDTGAFYESMYVQILKDSIVINANPIKGEDNLFFKYGNGIIGLTNENIQKLTIEVKKRYIKEIKRTLFRD